MRRPSPPVLSSLLYIVALVVLFPAEQLHSEAAQPAADTLILANGDTLHGKLVRAVDGKVVFHSDVLGDLTLNWDQVKELHTAGRYAVLDRNARLPVRGGNDTLPTGPIEVAHKEVRIEVEGVPAPPLIPVKDARFILDVPTLDRDLRQQPGPLSGWQGAATAGGTLVSATQQQYTATAGISLVRAIPTVDWLSPRNKTSLGFTGSFGKIIQPSYTDSTGTYVASVTTKSALYHAAAERDEYISTRLYLLGAAAFDHNYSQSLDLQQVYGGGLGWTALKTAHRQADLKATLQYEKQSFLSSSSGDQNLIGSTFSASYVLHVPLFTYTQTLSYLPAWNNLHAYSASESNTVAFPAHKNLSFTLGTLDSYLNDPPSSEPPTQRNSFQFTMGLSYAIHARP